MQFNSSANLASAVFQEQDAGSGPVHSSPVLGPVTISTHNITARHLHDITSALPDDRQFLRSWRRQLQDCLTDQNAAILRFLVTDSSGLEISVPAAAAELNKRCSDVLTKYSRPTWNFASSVRDLNLSMDMTEANAEMERELGISSSALRDGLRRAIRLYVNTAAAVCSAELRLEDKLKRLDLIANRVNDLMFLEPTTAMEHLAGPTQDYLKSVMEKITIDEEYKELIAQYKKFAVLKGIVSLGNFQKSAGPTCSVCMTKEVTMACIPCGHTFCEECCRSQTTSCFMCRVQVRDRVRLYFS